jgi:hypothetical protein
LHKPPLQAKSQHSAGPSQNVPALSQAVIALAYYTMETNPVLVREARNWLAQVLADWPA